MQNSIIHEVWKQEQEILDVVAEFCDIHGLRYSLFYGTLLGAVRHGGFIPWDDDIDILMPREDYIQFRELWLANPAEGYLLQDHYTDFDYVNNFMKIRKKHTTFLQSEEERDKKYHKGIFVDIFPADRVAPNAVTRKLQFAAACINLLYSRGYTSGHGGFIGLTERVLLALPKRVRPGIWNATDRYLSKWVACEKEPFFCACTFDGCKAYFPADAFEKTAKVEFNGKSYASVQDTDAVLKVMYGDYRQLPPPEKRVWTHHPILVDYSHNYEELEPELKS